MQGYAYNMDMEITNAPTIAQKITATEFAIKCAQGKGVSTTELEALLVSLKARQAGAQ